MSVAELILILLIQSMVSLSTFSLLVLPFIVNDQQRSTNKRTTEHAEIDFVAGFVPWTATNEKSANYSYIQNDENMSDVTYASDSV